MLVSVYLPTRNRRALLERAVYSVLDQSFRDFELIVVNDASTDGTAEFLAHISCNHSCVNILNSARPLGASAARNAAIREARGAFVTGLDDDDTFLPGRLAAFVTGWRAQLDAGVKPSCLYAQDLIAHGDRVEETRKPSGVEAADLISANHIGNQVFAPRAHFLACGAFDEALPAWQDLECFMRMLTRFGRARLVDVATYRLDQTRRQDRISINGERRLRAAYERVAGAHAKTAVERSRLRRQLFTEVYQMAPRLEDFRSLVADGVPLREVAQLSRLSWRLWRGRHWPPGTASA